MGQNNALYKFSIKYLCQVKDKTNQIICVCGFDLFCPLFEQRYFLSNICILHCLVPLNSVLFLTLFVSIHFRTLAVLLVLGKSLC